MPNRTNEQVLMMLERATLQLAQFAGASRLLANDQTVTASQDTIARRFADNAKKLELAYLQIANYAFVQPAPETPATVTPPVPENPQEKPEEIGEDGLTDTQRAIDDEAHAQFLQEEAARAEILKSAGVKPDAKPVQSPAPPLFAGRPKHAVFRGV